MREIFYVIVLMRHFIRRNTNNKSKMIKIPILKSVLTLDFIYFGILMFH
jgi:hypothetical protein